MDWHMLFTHPFHADNVGWYTGVVIVIDAIH